MGLEKEASKLFTLLLNFYPSNHMIRMAGVPPSMVEDVKRAHLQQNDTQAQQLVSYNYSEALQLR